MDVSQQTPKCPVLRMIEGHWEVTVDPLVVDVVVHPNDVDVVGPSSELRAHATRKKVQRLELGQVVLLRCNYVLRVRGPRNDMDGRLSRSNSCSRVHGSDRLDCSDSRLSENDLESVAAVFCKWIDVAQATARPSPKGY